MAGCCRDAARVSCAMCKCCLARVMDGASRRRLLVSRRVCGQLSKSSLFLFRWQVIIPYFQQRLFIACRHRIPFIIARVEFVFVNTFIRSE